MRGKSLQARVLSEPPGRGVEDRDASLAAKISKGVKKQELTASGQELAELLGISVETVCALALKNIAIRVSRGRYDLRESVKRYCAHLRATAAGRGGESGVLNLTEQRARLAREQANIAGLKASKLRGELVPVSEVEARWRGVLTAVRSRLLAVPSRVRSRAPHLAATDVEIVDKEIREALEELAA
jgi:phage terminase Nu1 subunit (DNA packaging protein)